MPLDVLRDEDYELSKRDSSDSSDPWDIDDIDFETQGLTSNAYLEKRTPSLLGSILQYLPWRIRRRIPHKPKSTSKIKSRSRSAFPSRRRFLRRFCHFCVAFALILVLLASIVSILSPSYTRLPPHYEGLKSRIVASEDDGRANVHNERVFIAASLYDPKGKLLSGAWAQAVVDLVNLLGSQNVFLSIYENDGDQESKSALKKLGERIKCRHRLNYEDHLSLEGLPKVTLPNGSERVKRIAYLAETRNRALAPLDEKENQIYDKVLFLNDVIFNPLEAAQLLFSTHADENGKANFNAACAVDFINPFKFYDTFATRDLEGYSMGVPFFPWFSKAGKRISRSDVLKGTDAVRVKSCWSGMVAFDGKYLQQALFQEQEGALNFEKTQARNESQARPLRFRSSDDADRESSECCLIHADLAALQKESHNGDDIGIYQNPFIRVAYGKSTLRWLSTIRRFERLFTISHTLVDWLAGMPRHNPFRNVKNREEGGFCSIKGLQVMRESPRSGEKNWETIKAP